MTVGATAITIFHPPSDPQRFDRWVTGYLASARHCIGHVSARRSVQGSGQLDWAVEVSFESADQLDAWLDSDDRQALLSDGQAQGCWRSAADLILARGELPPANTGVFLHSVTPEKEAEFVSAQSDLTTVSSGFPGYEGTALFPADSSGQWMSVLRFRTAGQLTGWIRSRERREALPRLRRELTRDFAELSRSAPFGSTVRVADGQTRITPAWKTAMLVVLCLYPTVILLSKSLAPALSHAGVGQALAVFIGNVISVALLQWVLVPAASLPFRRWLDPIDGELARISVAGAVALVVAYAALVLIFTLTG
ncbi:antibiotic biosynthesis monooxygenase [Mycobacterium sp. 852002-51163_SCH5372311]|uniref:antibiotic biosynthesis monooxygenase n=1 Tax=Mycobacterium sp. 852002-51163_SCH5372311 TaxID=1834097 RepID=UPI000B321DB4|nr:antibiotic biosynthesis monooxygenase [Mycobacterium sp. 852002-51163_SCH5372311]